jgi:hypothetical protein
VITHPDIGEAFATAGAADRLLKGVAFAGGVGGRRVRLAEHVAEIDEVRLSRGAFRLGIDFPAMDKFGD